MINSETTVAEYLFVLLKRGSWSQPAYHLQSITSDSSCSLNVFFAGPPTR